MRNQIRKTQRVLSDEFKIHEEFLSMISSSDFFSPLCLTESPLMISPYHYPHSFTFLFLLYRCVTFWDPYQLTVQNELLLSEELKQPELNSFSSQLLISITNSSFYKDHERPLPKAS